MNHIPNTIRRNIRDTEIWGIKSAYNGMHVHRQTGQESTVSSDKSCYKFLAHYWTHYPYTGGRCHKPVYLKGSNGAALKLLGNAFMNANKERRRNIIQDLHPNLIKMFEDDRIFKDATSLLLREGFSKKVDEKLKCLSQATKKPTYNCHTNTKFCKIKSNKSSVHETFPTITIFTRL